MPLARLLQQRLHDVALEHDVAERDERARPERAPRPAPASTPRRSSRSPRCRRSARPATSHGLGAVAAHDGDARGSRSAARSSSSRARIGRPCTLSMALGTVAVSPPKSAPAPAASTTADERLSRGGQVAPLGLLQLGVALQPEDLVERRHLRLDGRAATRPRGAGAPSPAWRAMRRPQQVVRPDHHADAARAEVLGRRALVLGRHDHHRRAVAPLVEEREDLGRARLARCGSGSRRRRPRGRPRRAGAPRPAPSRRSAPRRARRARSRRRVWLSLPALILPQNSSTSASGWRSARRKELVFGKSLSSMATPATPRCSSLRTSRRMLLKLP